MAPPVVVMPVLVMPDGDVMVSPMLPPPELRVMLVAAEAETVEAVPRNVNCGVLIVSVLPFVMVSVVDAAIVIDPLVFCELKLTEPEDVGVKV